MTQKDQIISKKFNYVPKQKIFIEIYKYPVDKVKFSQYLTANKKLPDMQSKKKKKTQMREKKPKSGNQPRNNKTILILYVT